MDNSSILNEIEFEELQKFLNNQTLKNAVKKVLLTGIYNDGTLRAGLEPNPNKNFILGFASNQVGTGASNELLGADVRAVIEGIRMIEVGYANLEKLKKVEGVKAKAPINKGK